MRLPRARTALLLAAAALLLALGLVAASRYAVSLLKAQVEAALGPESEVGAIGIEGGAVVLSGLRIRAPAGWPTEDALRAETIVVEPDLRALLSGDVRIGRITADGAYLAILRNREGRTVLLPSLLERGSSSSPEGPSPEGSTAGAATAVTIEQTVLNGAVVEFFDARIRTRPHRIRVADLHAEVGRISLPGLDAETPIAIHGTAKGPRRDGSVAVDGTMRFADLDSDIKTTLRGIDLAVVEPYLLESSEMATKRGTLDLDLRSKVSARKLSAPGTLTLADLELSGKSFMGLPRQAVLAAMKDRGGKITVRFELAGSLDDPKFSLQQSFAMRVSLAVADGLGISVRGLASGLGSAAGNVTKKLGDLLGR